MKSLALFDFDGTLTTRDTFIDFSRRVMGHSTLARWASLNPRLLATYAIGRRPLCDLKLSWISFAFAGYPVTALEARGREYAEKHLPHLMNDSALARLKWHKDEGHEIWIVSASLRYWLAPWCEVQGVGLLCTELEERGGALTGRLSQPHCDGPEKAQRIRAKLDLSSFGHIYAYGDSDGDREMLQLRSR